MQTYTHGPISNNKDSRSAGRLVFARTRKVQIRREIRVTRVCICLEEQYLSTRHRYRRGIISRVTVSFRVLISGK